MLASPLLACPASAAFRWGSPGSKAQSGSCTDPAGLLVRRGQRLWLGSRGALDHSFGRAFDPGKFHRTPSAAYERLLQKVQARPPLWLSLTPQDETRSRNTAQSRKRIFFSSLRFALLNSDLCTALTATALRISDTRGQQQTAWHRRLTIENLTLTQDENTKLKLQTYTQKCSSKQVNILCLHG